MNLTPGKIAGVAVAGLLTVATLVSLPMLFENLDSSELMVIQSVSGSMRVVTEPGWSWQGFGTVTKYPRRSEFRFSTTDDKEADARMKSPGLNVRFYDGGNAIVNGSMSWQMPLDAKSVIEIHRDFRSPEAFETSAIRRSMEGAAIQSGPMMSSFESAAGRRNELLQVLNDQTLNGVYKTSSRTIKLKDVAGIEKDTTVTEIVKDDKGLPVRAQESYVKKYNVQLLPMTISGIRYEDRVESQIREQQQATNQVSVAAANAKRADQEAITAEAQGRANAAKAKWEQEVLNAKTVADAQAKILIADASVKEAEAFKKAEILRGEGEAKRKELVMNADGQLDKKLEAVVAVNRLYADAIQKAQPGAWSPQIVMGKSGGDGSNGSSATALVDLLTARTAKQLGVDLAIQGAAATAKK
jgi:regulator of protease activity HflC (stomatin/prohibitin superfamily)